jgi:hypothetical protein
MGEESGLTPEERKPSFYQVESKGSFTIVPHWAKVYLMKAGLVRFPRRGTFVAADTP